jgi:hypothetical protein
MINSDAVMAVTFFGAIASLAWSATIAWTQWLKHRADAPPLPQWSDGVFPSDTARLAQLESAVDELSVELERMAEAQRFTIRLLDERLPAQIVAKSRPGSSDSGRAITPH